MYDYEIKKHETFNKKVIYSKLDKPNTEGATPHAIE